MARGTRLVELCSRSLRSAPLPGLALLLVAACSSGEKAQTPAAGAPGSAAQQAAVKKPQADFSGVLHGVVKLVEGAEVPRAPEPVERVVPPPAPCLPYGDADRDVVSMAADTRALSPVHVAITQMASAPEHKPTQVDLRIDSCRLGPKLVGAVSGDSVRVTNHSDVAMLPLLPGDTYLESIAKGKSRSAKITRLGPTRIKCGIAGYCGESIVITLSHPLFAVTNEKGEFTIKGVPLGQDLTVHAAHPHVGVVSQKFRLTKEKPEHTLELVITPRAPKPAAAAAADGKEPGDAKAGDAKADDKAAAASTDKSAEKKGADKAAKKPTAKLKAAAELDIQ
jgi:hypothetical protein